MPRLPRFLLSKSYYHIMTRGNNRNKIFRCDEDYKKYLSLLAFYKEELPFDLYHYCLMPSHVHMLIRTRSADSFSVFMKKINLSYFHYYKHKLDWVGHFWQGRFKSQPIGKDDYFIQCGKYIELNPVRANLVNNPKLYKYSSYNYYAYGKSDSLLTDDIFYSSLENTNRSRQLNYRKLIINETIIDTYKKQTWGNPHQSHNEQEKIRYHLRKREEDKDSK